MKLFTNGCSFTWGAEILENQFNIKHTDLELKNPKEQERYENFRRNNVWSYFLHEKLKTSQVDNLSMGGGSNKRIVRTTLDFFISRIDKNQSVDDYLAVIQWTDINRTEIYDYFLDNYLSMSHHGATGLNGVSFMRNYDNYHKEIYKLDKQNFIDDFRYQILALSCFFEKYNIKYLFCNMNNTALSLSEYYYTNFPWLQPNLNLVLHHKPRKYFYPQGHPNIAGHKLIAEKLYNRLQELYTL